METSPIQLPPHPVASAEGTSALCPHTGGWLALHRRVGHSYARTHTHTTRPSPPERCAWPRLAPASRASGPGAALGLPLVAPGWTLSGPQPWAQPTRAGFSPGNKVQTLAKSFNGRAGCSDNATRVGTRSCGGRGVNRRRGRAGSLKKRRARTGGQWRAGGCYMMEQADSGFRTWQAHAAPQYCRKVW